MIYLKLKSKPKRLNTLLRKLFNDCSHGFFGTVETFKDEDCTELQCRAGKFRSFDDVFEVAKTYFPQTTEKKVVETLFKLKFTYEGNRVKIFIANCHDIKKPTLAFSGQGMAYGKSSDNTMYKSKYKWSSLLALVNKNYDNFLED